jgi:triosephosphate isomerase
MADVVVAPSPLHVDYVCRTLKRTIQVAAQNCSQSGPGAFTGEISAAMLWDFGVSWVIAGHSERRAKYGEDSKTVANKVSMAQASGLRVIACIGETLADRKAGNTLDVIFEQLGAISATKPNWANLVVAYEPVWAIGTGVAATKAQVQEVHAAIRAWVAKQVSAPVAAAVHIIYGGSVKPTNCDELIALQDVDGFLVGGASLKPLDFGEIINAPVKSKL